MEKVVIKATKRDITGKKVGALRRAGKLPAVLYGHNIESVAVLLDRRESSKVLNSLTSSSLVTIDLDGKEHSALVREKQRDYIKNEYIHIDFQVVSLTEKIRATVTIELVGVSPAIKEFNGVVINGLNEIKIEAFPQDLPEKITFDLSNLKQIGDGYHVRDIQLGDKVEILDSLDEMIVIITGGTTEDEISLDEPTMLEPEVIEKGKKEEEVE